MKMSNVHTFNRVKTARGQSLLAERLDEIFDDSVSC
jgi:hypothetical protein